MKRFFIFCDESIKNGRFYSNFYGGALIDKQHYELVKTALQNEIKKLQIEDSELKWSKINSHRTDYYCKIMDVFFSLIKKDFIKVRIMFTDNRFVPSELNELQRKTGYHLLYYQFIKHVFGFKYLISDKPIFLELFFDTLPDKHTKNQKFKDHIFGLQFLPEFTETNLKIDRNSIYEVDSKDHIILQCTDIVLGAMAFRLNQHHKDKPEGSFRRGKRTIAKEKFTNTLIHLLGRQDLTSILGNQLERMVTS